LIRAQNLREKAFFAASPRLVNSVHMNGIKPGRQTQSLDLAFLEPPKAGSHQKTAEGQFPQHCQITIAPHGRSHFKRREHTPTRCQHFPGKPVPCGDPVQRMTPAIVEGLKESRLRHATLVGRPDSRKRRRVEMLPDLVGGSQAVVQVENGGFDHAWLAQVGCASK
jgi:hypothetical protein